MGVRILHIIDDTKFIDYCKATYEIDELQNTYLPFGEVQLDTLRDTFDFVFIHYLRRNYHRLLTENYFDSEKVVWVVWGADAFSLGRFFNKHLMPQTWRYRLKASMQKSFSHGCKIAIKSVFPSVFDFQAMNREVLVSIRKIKNIIVLMPNDAIALKKTYGISANFYHINYVDPIFTKQTVFDFNYGNYVLVGNSAEFTNNHIDALRLISLETLGNKKLLIPLSYGDNFHAKIVESYAKQKFDNQAITLRDFISFDEYVKLISRCEIAIMPHIRQQAIGNIVKLLLQGTHIYFHPASSVYQFLQEKGFTISTIYELKQINSLSDEQKLQNQRLALRWFGANAIHSRVRELIVQLTTNPS